MDLYIIECTIEPPFVLLNEKCVEMEFFFQFYNSDVFVENEDAPYEGRAIHGRALFALSILRTTYKE